MFIRKTKISKYTLRISSPRVTPSNSLTDVEWNNETPYKRKTISRHSSKKMKHTFIAIAGGLTIAILIAIVVLVSVITQSKSTTTKTTKSTSNVTPLANILVSSTTFITSTLLATSIITTSTSTETTTTTALSSTTTTSQTTVTTSTSIIITTSETTTTSTTSHTTTSTTSSSTSTSETTTSSTSTSTSTSETTTSTTSSSTSTSETTTSSTSTSTSTSETTTSTTSSSTSTSETTTSSTSSSTSTSETTTTSTSTSTSTSETTTTTTTSETTTSSTSSSTSTSETTTSSTTTSTTTSETTTTTASTTTTSVTIGPLRWNTTGITVAGQLTVTSVTPTALYFPLGIFIDSSDVLYVADAKNNRIQQFFPDNSTGTTVAGLSNGVGGTTASYLNYTNDVATDTNGNVYVVDTYNDRVQLWNVNATAGVTIAGTGISGNSSNQLDSPRAVALDPNTNTFYITDTGNARIMSYTLNSTVGTLVAGGNGVGNSRTQLNDPRGIHFDSTTNSLIIANRGANNIVRWKIGASNWTLLAGSASGSTGSGPTAFNNPWDVTLDPMGNMYVVDRYNYRIQFFRAGESNGTTIAGVTAMSGNSATRLYEPLSVALDSQLNLYVSDSQNHRIQKFVRY